MALPLIPIAAGTVTLAAGVSGATMLVKSHRRKRQYQAIYDELFGEYEKQCGRYLQKCAQVNERLARLESAKKDALKTLSIAFTLLARNAQTERAAANDAGFTTHYLDGGGDTGDTGDARAADAPGALGGGDGDGGTGGRMRAAWGAGAGVVSGRAGFGGGAAAVSGVSDRATGSGTGWARAVGGALAALGGGIAFGAISPGSIPLDAAWLTGELISRAKTQRDETEIRRAIHEIHRAIAEMHEISWVADLVVIRIDELTDAVKELGNGLQQLLSRNASPDTADGRAVAATTFALSQVVNVVVIDTEDKIADTADMKDAYRLHLRDMRKQELSYAYAIMREAIVVRDYERLGRLLLHIVGMLRFNH